MTEKNRKEREYYLKHYILNRKYLVFSLLFMIVGGIVFGVVGALIADDTHWTKAWPIFRLVGVAVLVLASDFFYSLYSKKKKR